MRPVNLIPPEERRGEKAPMRTGPLAYVVVAVLALALLALVVTVLTNNQIADRKSEKASLQSQVDQAQAEAKRLQSFADFASMQQARELTVTSLAQSRFDWQRVLREISIVIPPDVWLTDLTGKVSPEAGTADSSASSSSSSSSTGTTNIAGPSLDIKGCASGHDAVAEFIAALQDVDGVTRVSVLSSDRPDPSSAGATGGNSTASADSSSVGGTCSARNFISTFEVIAAFDAVPTAAAGGTAAPTSPTAAPASVAGDPTASAADKSQVADGEQQLQQQKASAKQQTDKAHKDVHTLIPGTGTAP